MFRNQIVEIDHGIDSGMLAIVRRMDLESAKVEVRKLGLHTWEWMPISHLKNTARLRVLDIGDRRHVCQFVSQCLTDSAVNNAIEADKRKTGRTDYHIQTINDEQKAPVYLVWAIGPHDKEGIAA
jgi:hypothetical protein